jgi:GTPase SAR1 family protein
MISLKAVWRDNKDGFIFIFAINNLESFESVISEIREIKHKEVFSSVAIILVGNKADLESERKVWIKTAQTEANALGVKYFEISAKTSSKDEINALICELIDINEMNRFNVETTK